ncbi:hypothetical protein N864_15450 [Intrasporangium chromatireducens Q5-1]|uniref:Chemotaxis methyl-accepting receptor HlyB-like 4HB MCP domain-containing protein n=1 Tax=Intrasporangium chromatireducens Q5-1 TaxID=584657 RepID=W9GH65_9MICO|nr:hypothetical protein [Intrasporangium chromatireducens]EWT04168.1 hypothetical protein N864_15450 [Intrasporangium chromatireducens Q5-1]
MSVSAPRTIQGSLPTIPQTTNEARTVFHSLVHGTPGRMRLLGVVAVVAALLLGAVCAQALIGSRAAADRAATNIAQVVRAQSLQVDLLRADALATNAFLVGGLEPSDQRAAYDQAMTTVAKGIAEAAAAQPADGDALAALSVQVQTYATLVEQARSNNRLGLPVGATYLTQASAGLRSDAIPIIDSIVRANEGRATAEFDRADSTALLLVGVVAVIVLIGVAVWLARRTHRYVNAPLAVAIVLLVIGLVVALSTIGTVGATAADVRANQYQDTVQLARVSTAANDARANESLTLIRRGSGSDNEKAWKADATTVEKALAAYSTPLLQEWQRYADGHREIRSLDDHGNWDKAVSLATSTQAQAPGTLFAQFDKDVTAQRDAASQGAVARIDGLGGAAPAYAVGIGLLSLIACWLIIRGIGKRIEEYT